MKPTLLAAVALAGCVGDADQEPHCAPSADVRSDCTRVDDGQVILDAQARLAACLDVEECDPEIAAECYRDQPGSDQYGQATDTPLGIWCMDWFEEGGLQRQYYGDRDAGSTVTYCAPDGAVVTCSCDVRVDYGYGLHDAVERDCQADR